jgi:hypothetical protein
MAEQEMLDRFALAAVSIMPPPAEFMGERETKMSYEKFATRAYKIAEAMMEERDKRPVKEIK